MAAGSPSSPAVEAPRPAAGVPLVAGARLPLAFIAAGLAALAFAAAWAAADPALLLLPYLQPSVVALAHVWLPGFLLSVCCGAVYQLMPVVLGAPLRIPLVLGWTHLALHVAGTAALVTGFALGRFEVVAVGGGAIASGTLIIGTATWRTFLASKRRDAIGWCFPLAGSWLVATAAAGVLLALNRRCALLPVSVVALLQAHAHLGLAGFFLTLLQGATFQLVPMFTLGDLRRPRWVAAGLISAQAGLLAVTPGLALGRRGLTVAGAALLAAGVASSGVALAATLRSRRRRGLEPGVRAFLAGAGALGAAAVAGVTLSLIRDGAAPGLAGVYGTAVIAGALGLMVSGMLCKIVPFLVWMRTYGPRAGRQPVPLATALGSKPLERAWLALHLAGLALVLAGQLVSNVPAVTAGAWLIAAAVALFGVNVVRIARHLVRPAMPPAAAPAFSS